jgi:hypothetical protein
MIFQNKPKIPHRGVSEALDLFKGSLPGTHCLMVYPDLMTLRGIYSHYTKIQLEDNNEIVLILPYYETTDMVRLALSGRDNSNNPFGFSGINVSKYEKDGSLIIMDSLKVYFPLDEQSSNNDNDDNPKCRLDFMSFIDILLKKQKDNEKSVSRYYLTWAHSITFTIMVIKNLSNMRAHYLKDLMGRI